jgi:hypothetical protein
MIMVPDLIASTFFSPYTVNPISALRVGDHPIFFLQERDDDVIILLCGIGDTWAKCVAAMRSNSLLTAL